LLNSRKRSLLDIAQEVGYKDSFYFSRKFKQFVGVPPTAYRRKKKRFATLNPNHTGCLLALGVMPVLGVYFSWLESQYNTSPIAGAIAEKFDPYAYSADLFYKKMEEAHPDVIVGYDTAPENKSLLFIAPVIGLSVMKQSWREQFQHIADAAGRKETAAEWLRHYDQEIEAANQLLDHRYGTRGSAIVWEIGDGQAYCLSASYGRGCHILYQDLGFYPPNAVVEQGLDVKGFVETTIENMVAYPADYIFITSLPTDEASCRSLEQLFQSKQWQQLGAVQGQRVYILNESELFYGYDPLSTKAQLKVLLQAFLSTS
jgi:ABC-type Fe3+-hydroxamate transport system substrate-binding protein